MVLKLRCPGCGYTLRFVDNQAGQLVRCFNCDAQCKIPIRSARENTDDHNDESSPRMAIADAWYLKNAADQQYGPVPKSQIVEWINEGRIDDTFQVRQAEGTWQQTSQLFRELPRRETRDRTRKRTEDRPGTDVDNATDNTLTAADDYLQPHHGEVVLALSVLGLFCCGCGLPLSLIATVWGALQLGKIRDGTVDPSGRGMLRAGSLLGMVPCVIIGLYLAYLLLRMIVG